MLPCDDMFLRSLATQRPNYPVSRYDRLPMIIEKELASLLDKEIRYHHRLERSKAELQKRYDFSTLAAFDSVDTLRRGCITNEAVQSFLKVNGYYATEQEVIAIIRRLDVDAD